ncbi:hypothetical protein JL721_4436 [Aureococcus anophagefferens]|nr:hypothetical protein JL721_4436 [Aureococcus anophagefferens]
MAALDGASQANNTLDAKPAAWHYIMYRTHVMHKCASPPAYAADAPTFWLDNGSWVAKFVVAHLLKRGWRPAADPRGRMKDGDAISAAEVAAIDFCYVRTARKVRGLRDGDADAALAPAPLRPAASFASFARGPAPAPPPTFQLVNHFAGGDRREDALTCKARLGLALWRHVDHPKHPETCVCFRRFDQLRYAVVGGDLGRVLAAAALPDDASRCVVIVKPSRGACGRGIKVLKLRADERGAFEAPFHDALRRHYADGTDLTVQSYVARPLLLKDERKFDVRCYLLLVSLPTAATGLCAYYHEGYLRASAGAYPGVGADDEELEKYAHVTNNSFQKELPGFEYATYKVGDKELRIPWPALDETLAAKTDVGPGEIHGRFMAAILDAVEAGVKGEGCPRTRTKHGVAGLAERWAPGQFSLLGIDFILGEDGSPYLIEFSKAPGIRDVPPFLGVQNRELMTDALDLGLEGASNPIPQGWDPMGLAELGTPATLAWFRAAELKHSRVAMAATVGWIINEAGVVFPGDIATGVPFASLGKGVTGTASEFQKPHYMSGGRLGSIPGPFGLRLWDPIGSMSAMDESTKATKRQMELNNGRLAMIGVASFISASYIDGSVPALPSGW